MNVKHGMYKSYPRLMMSIDNHVKFIRCESVANHKWYKRLRIPAKYLGVSGKARFALEVVKRFPEMSKEYERNKKLVLEKDVSREPVFAPWNIRFTTQSDNLSGREKTTKLAGHPLTKICQDEGIPTRLNGKKSPEYNRISRMWLVDRKIHPTLWNARKQNLEKEERLLESTKLECRRAELMIEAYKELLASKQTS